MSLIIKLVIFLSTKFAEKKPDQDFTDFLDNVWTYIHYEFKASYWGFFL